ncbi:hypothetical protein [Trinickia sp. EG282A]|uniref:hypothetical protein n=1 Tax=Trinickia sp. EG282A TaxID=3237013 RepID=UPI0034D16AFD
MHKYFIDDREVDETAAAAAWFDRAEHRGIDIPKAISLWEDASERTGEESRRIVAHTGVRVEVKEK